MKFRSVFHLVAAVFWIATMSAGPVLAQGAAISLGVKNHDSSVPVEITSEELALDQANSQAIFSGDVIVKQGDITLTCQKMHVEYGEHPDTGTNEIQVIRMFGNVTFVSAQEAAEADQAVYTLSDDVLIMTGNVLVTQGVTALSADKMTYNLDSGNGHMEGRVKTVLQQGKN